MVTGFQSYCGVPPTVATLWARWNLDPILIAVLIVALVVAVRFSTVPRRPLLVAGWGIGALAVISPLCALSVSLFAARVAQHMILATVVAPLIAAGLPAPRGPLGRSAAAGAAVFAVVLWLWHAPGPYVATFTSDAAYWTMHVSIFATALWFWRAVIDAHADRLGVTTAATLFTGAQMALLGAVIAFARRPLYAPHWLTTIRWGLTPLQDQQFGGTVMWIPAGLIIAAAILAPLAAALREPDGRAVGA